MVSFSEGETAFLTEVFFKYFFENINYLPGLAFLTLLSFPLFHPPCNASFSLLPFAFIAVFALNALPSSASTV